MDFGSGLHSGSEDTDRDNSLGSEEDSNTTNITGRAADKLSS